MSVINTNITSMIGQSNLSKSQNALQTSMERLSSGLRINSAKDDAAGQAIANRMSSQITGLAQAQRNANDGISVAQTAEGALNQVNDNLQRIRELTVQALNDTNSPEDRKSIQAEIEQRLTEINRISDETDFNGVKVLGEDRNIKIQVGAKDNQVIEVDLDIINQDELGLGTFDVTNISSTPFSTTQVTEVAGAVVDLTGVTGIAGDPTAFELHGYGEQDELGVYENYAIKDESGNFYKISKSDIDTSTAGQANVESDFTDAADLTKAYKDFKSDETTGATGMLGTLDAALEKVDNLRSDLGAIQNRFESAITNLQTNETNLSAARSRIEDADYAVEVANMTRAQILQQAGTSVLAQANQIPQNVLSLLG